MSDETAVAPTGDLAADAARLTAFVVARERRLVGLPAVPERTRAQRMVAADVSRSCRETRDLFITCHADRVYHELTEGRTRRPRLRELVLAAASRYPGLVPTREQWDHENSLPLRHKEGREVDQGIFLRGILRSPSSGRHLADSMRLPTARARELLDEFHRTGRVELGTVVLARDGRVARLTIHNEHCLNAEDAALLDDMEIAVDLALLDAAVHVGVLRGAVMTHPKYRGRRVFSAGLNLRALGAGQISLVDFLLCREFGLLSKLAHGLSEPEITKPWVAAVDGFAIGGGTQLVLVCDWVVAAADAYFSLPAAEEGIVPGAANLRLPRLVGGRVARRLILAGDRVLAAGPDGRLLCDTVADPDGMDEAVAAAAARLAQPAVAANRRMLAMAEEPPDLLRSYLAEFAVVQAHRMLSDDVIGKVSGHATADRH